MTESGEGGEGDVEEGFSLDGAPAAPEPTPPPPADGVDLAPQTSAKPRASELPGQSEATSSRPVLIHKLRRIAFMPRHDQIQHMLRHPQDLMRFQATGRLPQGQRAQGPLIDLLSQISPQDRIALRGIVLDRRLGYEGSRSFANAEQAWRWIAPNGRSGEIFGSFPAESWRNKRMTAPLGLDVLLSCCTMQPDGMLSRYRHLRIQSPSDTRSSGRLGEAGPADPHDQDDAPASTGPSRQHRGPGLR